MTGISAEQQKMVNDLVKIEQSYINIANSNSQYIEITKEDYNKLLDNYNKNILLNIEKHISPQIINILKTKDKNTDFLENRITDFYNNVKNSCMISLNPSNIDSLNVTISSKIIILDYFLIKIIEYINFYFNLIYLPKLQINLDETQKNFTEEHKELILKIRNILKAKKSQQTEQQTEQLSLIYSIEKSISKKHPQYKKFLSISNKILYSNNKSKTKTNQTKILKQIYKSL